LFLAEKAKRVFFALWCLAWLIVASKSLEPGMELPLGLSDKVVHFTAYAVMAAAVASFCHVPARVLGWVGLTVAASAVLELGQHFVPSRSMDILDLAANASGAACGALLALLWIALVVRPMRPGMAQKDGAQPVTFSTS
jgi:VanZ family protein